MAWRNESSGSKKEHEGGMEGEAVGAVRGYGAGARSRRRWGAEAKLRKTVEKARRQQKRGMAESSAETHDNAFAPSASAGEYRVQK